jgi:hypothetical protein
MKSRDLRQDEAIIALLRALPEERLERIIAEVAPRRRELVAPARDNRYCTICGKRYPHCRALYGPEGTIPNDHDFAPPKRESHAEQVERGTAQQEP